MKHQSASPIVAMVLLWGVLMASAAQTNKPVSIIFPPTNWDAGKHILAPYVATNKPGNYSLPFDWAGFEKVTARSGWYTDRVAMVEQTNIFFHFDQLLVVHKPWFRADRFLGNSESSFGPGYRRSLPSDAELLQMRDVSSVSNFLGENPFSSRKTYGTGGSAIGVRFFTLRPNDSLSELQVTFMKRNQGSRVDSILVRRAVLYPQRKRQ